MDLSNAQLYRCKKCKQAFVIFTEKAKPAVLACPWCCPPVPGLARRENVVRKIGGHLLEKAWNWWKSIPTAPDDD